MTDLNLDLNQSLDLRVAQFKSDPEKMAEVTEFLNDVFDKAQKEAEQRRNGKSSKGTLTEAKNSGHGLTVLNHLPECLRPESLPPYVIVPIQCGVLLLLATIIIRKYLWNKSSTI